MEELADAGYQGFCGGSGGYAVHYINKLDRINARTFAWCILIAEGWSEESFEYETEYRPFFENMFRDVFGEDEIALEPR